MQEGHLEMKPKDRDRLAALRKAKQLATIAIDWNLEEVEIDGEMVETRELRDEFEAAIAKATS